MFSPTSLQGTGDLHVLIGDREARVLAASPRVYVVESPRDVLGKTTLQVKRGDNVVAEGGFRNNRVSSANPWPFIIGVVVIAGIVIAVEAAKSAERLRQQFPSRLWWVVIDCHRTLPLDDPPPDTVDRLPER